MTPCGDIDAGLLSLPWSVSGGLERYYDALAAMVGDIDWRPGALRVVVAFFDENNMDSTITEAEAALALQRAGIKAIIFAGFQARFTRVTRETGGVLLGLDFDSSNVEAALEVNVGPPCR